ncbi:MAG: aldehyde dehydrogenase [Candidatus Pristimantibacillus sp.]
MNELIPSIVEQQRQFFHAGGTISVEARLRQLQSLRAVVKSEERRIFDALKQDLNKSEQEAYLTELGLVLTELTHTIKHLKRWVKPKRLKTPLTHMGSKSYLIPEPFGVTLIIAPWNYPVQLALVPLIGAIAAGNTVVLKPSELAPHVSAVLTDIIRKAFAPEWATVVEGDVQTSTVLLAEKMDYIFFTGSVAVGKIVMTAAAKQLTPVTLELGGKSPCIVHNDADLKLAAKRIAFGKFTNAGQTCVAPDYLYVHREVKDNFIQLLKQSVAEFYGEKPLLNENYVHMISDRHYNRLAKFLEEGSILFGGGTNAEQRIIEPTLIEGITWESAIMQEEIFGPLLPLMVYDSLEEVISEVSSKARPLALYLFSNSLERQQQVIERVSFGGGCMNDTIMHFGSPYLPIGGVGDSGIGRYHGESSFFTFSHQKSLLRQTTRFDIPFRYPTSKLGAKVIRKLMR